MLNLINSQINKIQSDDLIIGTTNANDTHHITTNQVCDGLFFSEVSANANGRLMGIADLFTATNREFSYFAQRANAIIKEWRKDGKLILNSGTLSYDNSYFYIQLFGKGGIENLKLGLSDSRIYTLKSWPLV